MATLGIKRPAREKYWSNRSCWRGDCLSFVYRHPTKDITKNVPHADGILLVHTLLNADFRSANLFTTKNDIELTYDKNGAGRLRVARPTCTMPPAKEHNRPKQRVVPAANASYLKMLGVTREDGTIKKGMEAKYRQINKFIEIIDGLIQSSPLKDATSLAIVDMGSGKGYLTFALYDHLTSRLKKQATLTGVEVRPDLVDLCNGIAEKVGFAGLHFECGTIENYVPGPTDLLIALHACDTATDQALFRAVEAGASLVICAPCCHQELRRQMTCALPGLGRVLKFGILEERQAELVTDGLRALLLESRGYKTSVFEFISTEHTSKNIMIVGVKINKPANPAGILEQVAALKNAFGLKTQYLETLLLGRNARI